MVDKAREFEKSERCKIELVYANGGTGMFLVKANKEVAERFGRAIQSEYAEKTSGGGSITFAVQEVPEDIDLWNDEKRAHPSLAAE